MLGGGRRFTETGWVRNGIGLLVRIVDHDSMDSRHISRESAEQQDIHPDPPSSDISTHNIARTRLTLFKFSSMSFLHSSGTQVCTNLPSVSISTENDIEVTYEARFMLGLPSTISADRLMFMC